MINQFIEFVESVQEPIKEVVERSYDFEQMAQKMMDESKEKNGTPFSDFIKGLFNEQSN